LFASVPPEDRTPQEQAARLCGEVVESQAQASVSEPAFVPCAPLVIRDEASVGLPGSDHLYAAARQGENMIKIGVSKDIIQRIRELAHTWGGQYELLAVWPNVELLKSSKANIGTSREHFNSNASFEHIRAIVVSARTLRRTVSNGSVRRSSSRKPRRHQVSVLPKQNPRILSTAGNINFIL